MERKHNMLALLFCLLSFQSHGQDVLEIRAVVRDSLYTSGGIHDLSVELRAKNNGKSDLLLYGVGSHLVKFMVTEDRVCNLDQVGAGIAIMIFDERHERKYATFRIHDDAKGRPLTQQEYDASLAQSRERLLAATRIIPAGDEVVINWTIDLSDYALDKGIYTLKLIYFSGDGVRSKENLIGDDQVRNDLENSKASLYRGCAISNFVEFIVR
jgi:hypothetical protein